MLSFILLISFCCCLRINNAQSSPYPIYNATGSHYEVGFSIGQQAKHRIQQYIKTYPYMQDLRHCLLTGCSVNLRDLVEYNKAIWPEYYAEMEGIAAGAEIDQMDVHLLSFRHEILTLREVKQSIQEDEGSDILTNHKGVLKFQGIGHNEDGWIGMEDTGYFSHYTIINENNENKNDFFAFDYPGSLIGHSFGFNSFGIAMTTNILFPFNVSIEARGIYWITRAILDSRNLSHAIDIINDYDKNGAVSSYGISLNIAYMNKTNNKIDMINVELSNYDISIQYYGDDNQHENEQLYGSHFDNYLRLDVVQEIDESSVHRFSRCNQLIEENGLNREHDIVNILGDNQDVDYPIYRNSTPPDSVSTLTTSIFDMNAQTMIIYDKCNPLTCNPAFSISF